MGMRVVSMAVKKMSLEWSVMVFTFDPISDTSGAVDPVMGGFSGSELMWYWTEKGMGGCAGQVLETHDAVRGRADHLATAMVTGVRCFQAHSGVGQRLDIARIDCKNRACARRLLQ
jgi:hypothetical protein